MTYCAPEHLPLARIQFWERNHPNNVYLTQPLGKGKVADYTWATVVGEARRIAAYLQQQGVGPGDRVAILSKNCAHWIMSDIAIWLAGGVSVPVYPTLTAESVRQILEHSGAKFCFVGKLDGFAQMQPGIPSQTQCIALPLAPPTPYLKWDEIVAKTAPLTGQISYPGESLATIVYTSGTTGMPKGVMHSFNTIGWAAGPVMEQGNLTPEDRMLSYLPLAHVAERWIVESCSFRAGFRIYFADALETFVDDLKRARPTYFISVPRLWTKFQQGVQAKLPPKKLNTLLKIPLLNTVIKRKVLAGLGLDAVRIAGGGAAPMPPSLIAWYRALGLELLEGYGMTENFGVSHGSRPGAARIGYVGETWSGVQHRISPEGEVQMMSPGLMMGYYLEPQKTAETLTEDGWLRTGDLGTIDEANRLKIIGRLKEQFKTSKGKYVSPVPIENRIATASGIEACCVVGAAMPQPMALLMLSADALAASQTREGREALEAEYSGHLAAVNLGLDDHEKLDCLVVVPDTWTVENGLITPTLKIKRPAVEAKYGGHFEQWVRCKKPVVWA